MTFHRGGPHDVVFVVWELRIVTSSGRMWGQTGRTPVYFGGRETGERPVCPRATRRRVTPVPRSLNRERRIAFYHLLLEIRTFVLAPELGSVSNPIENRSAIRLVLANDGTRQADEIRL